MNLDELNYKLDQVSNLPSNLSDYDSVDVEQDYTSTNSSSISNVVNNKSSVSIGGNLALQKFIKQQQR